LISIQPNDGQASELDHSDGIERFWSDHLKRRQTEKQHSSRIAAV